MYLLRGSGLILQVAVYESINLTYQLQVFRLNRNVPFFYLLITFPNVQVSDTTEAQQNYRSSQQKIKHKNKQQIK